MEYAEALLDRLKKAKRWLVFTGAGTSAESGIRTFRDEMDGLWSEYSVDDVVSLDGFLKKPNLVWQWHEWFRNLSKNALPNEAHFSIAALENFVDKLDVVTQNIDELHQRAGSQAVIELHGSIHRVCCFEHRHFVNQWPQTDKTPACTQCGSLLRHDIVWFGEGLPESAWSRAMEAASQADVVLSIGTSSVVYPAAQIPWIAYQAGAMVIEINPSETPLTQTAHHLIQQPAGKALPDLFSRLWPDQFLQALAKTKAQ